MSCGEELHDGMEKKEIEKTNGHKNKQTG